MKNDKTIVMGFALTALLVSSTVNAMGLRSFVALPVEKGGAVVRILDETNDSSDVSVLKMSMAYGISKNQTILIGAPYRLKPSGNDPLGDVSLLYRHIFSQQDSSSKTTRLAWLGGAIVPTDSTREAAFQLGAVATLYRERYEWDFDLLYKLGLNNRPDQAQYDISWQYRLTPSEYPEWGTSSEWDVVTELNGRWSEGASMTHQATLGLQWIHQQWVLEAGFFKDLNNNKDSHYLISTRFHF